MISDISVRLIPLFLADWRWNVSELSVIPWLMSAGINYNHVILEKPVRGRYARFCSSAEGYAEVAEMHFYKGEEEIVRFSSSAK